MIPLIDRRLGSWRFRLEREPLSASDLTHAYDRVAKTWDRTLRQVGSNKGYTAIFSATGLTEHLSQIAATLPGRIRVLDCGIGTGAFSGALSMATPFAFELDGIDISPAMLAIAEANLRSQGQPANLNLGDVRNLPYPDNHFDVVLSAHLLEHLVDPTTAMREMVRVMKPGGHLVACLTSKGFAGRFVQFKWRTHCLRPLDALTLFRAEGLSDARSVTIRSDGLYPKLGFACAGRK